MPRRLATAAVLALVAVAASGCTAWWRGTTRSYHVAPSGLPWGEEFVRRALVLGAFDQALARTRPDADGAPPDALLRALFQGQVAYHAGHWEESGRAFAEADRLTERRYTRSASRGVLSLLTNDHALLYVPTRTERLFSRYYAMMGRLQSGDLLGATVDARRLAALLEETASELDVAERGTHAMLREIVGAVFEAAGEWNDAGVAYRNAALLRGLPREAVALISASPPPGDSATVVLVLESGFAAHAVSRTVAIPVGQQAGPPVVTPSQWLTALDAVPEGGVFDEEPEAPMASPVAELGEVLHPVSAPWTPRRRGTTRYLGDRRSYRQWMEISWPALVRPLLPSAAVHLALSGGGADVPPWNRTAAVGEAPGWVADISDALGADARRLRGVRLARLTARTVSRLAVVEALDEQHGAAVGALAGLAASAMERADTRGWHLLPGRVALIRVTVPAGEVTPMLRQGAGVNAVPHALASQRLAPGAVAVLTARLWRDPAGAGGRGTPSRSHRRSSHRTSSINSMDPIGTNGGSLSDECSSAPRRRIDR